MEEPTILKFPTSPRADVQKEAPAAVEASGVDVGGKPTHALPELYWYAHVSVVSGDMMISCLKRFDSVAPCEKFIKECHKDLNNADSLKIVPFHHPDFLSEIRQERKLV